MSKLSFRARALDAAKPLPIYRNKDLPDLTDCVSINRAVPQMPSGMEKEEESEHHLQRAISAQQVFREKKESMVIPVPEARSNITYYQRLYRGDFHLPKQLVHVQPLALDLQQLPDYDMDSEDEILLSRINRKMDLKPAQFENMMDWLEKASSKQLVTLQEAKLLLKEDELLLKSVYDYWLRKRRVCHAPSLTPRVKRDTSSTNSDAYVAFRRRTEKMQTRKNRKSDEASYEKMLRLRRDFSKTMSILEMILKREKSKHQLLRLTAELVEKRYEAGDFSGEILKEVAGPLKEKPIYSAPISHRLKTESKCKPHKSKPESHLDGVRSHKRPRLQISRAELTQYDFLSSGDECCPASPESESDDENDPDGNFAFRRKAGCHYHAVQPEQEQTWQRRPLLALSVPARCLAVAGRRVGRGGRVVLDRASSDLNHALRALEPELLCGSSSCGVCELPSPAQILTDIRSSRWKLYRPLTPRHREKNTTFTTFTTTAAPHIPAKKVAGIVLTEEQFHSHQQQLALMHRLQQNPTPPPKVLVSDCVSKTLDSASAHFAASAVVSAEIRPRNGVLHQSGFRSARGEAGPVVSAVSPAQTRPCAPSMKLASVANMPKVIARENQEPERRALKVAMEVT